MSMIIIYPDIQGMVYVYDNYISGYARSFFLKIYNPTQIKLIINTRRQYTYAHIQQNFRIIFTFSCTVAFKDCFS